MMMMKTRFSKVLIIIIENLILINILNLIEEVILHENFKWR